MIARSLFYFTKVMLKPEIYIAAGRRALKAVQAFLGLISRLILYLFYAFFKGNVTTRNKKEVVGNPGTDN